MPSSAARRGPANPRCGPRSFLCRCRGGDSIAFVVAYREVARQVRDLPAVVADVRLLTAQGFHMM